MKQCKVCEQDKDESCFYKNKRMSDGYESKCISCKKEYQSQYGQQNKTKIAEKNKAHRSKNRDVINAKKKQHYEENKEQIAAQQKQYYEDNKQAVLDRNKEYRDNNKEKIAALNTKYVSENKAKVRAYRKQWRADNKDRANELARKRDKERRATDPKYKITRNLRARVYKAVVGLAKSDTTLNLLGCDIEHLKAHLELRFQDGMSWENYGNWHIDHVTPCASFDLSNTEEQEECFHYTNLQPLWAEDNLKKGTNEQTIHL
jgi:hypothetical protein